MKKLLLTLAVGIAMLSLPVIASAETVTNNNGYTNYSGACASVVYRGFTMYSTVKGANTGMKAFTVSESADKKLTGPLNAVGQFYTASGDENYFQVNAWINDTTVLEIDGENPISTNGSAIISNAEFYIYRTTGGATLTAPLIAGQWVAPWYNMSLSGTGSVIYIYGNALAEIARNTTTGAMTVSLTNSTASWITIYPVTSGSLSGNDIYNPAYIIAPTGPARMTLPAVSFAPIVLKPAASGYAGSWWDRNTAPVLY